MCGIGALITLISQNHCSFSLTCKHVHIPCTSKLQSLGYIECYSQGLDLTDSY